MNRPVPRIVLFAAVFFAGIIEYRDIFRRQHEIDRFAPPVGTLRGAQEIVSGSHHQQVVEIERGREHRLDIDVATVIARGGDEQYLRMSARGACETARCQLSYFCAHQRAGRRKFQTGGPTRAD